jgi:hypothetical protein
MTNAAPNNIDSPRFLSDISMNVAGRKMRESTSTPGIAGFSASRPASTPRVTSRVLAPGCFSTISISPMPSLITASPIGGGEPSTISATSPIRSVAPPRWRTGREAVFERDARGQARRAAGADAITGLLVQTSRKLLGGESAGRGACR